MKVLISLLQVVLPLFVALMYAAGIFYYDGYLHAFGTPYDMFHLQFNDTLLFGGMMIALFIFKHLTYFLILVALPFLICFCTAMLESGVKKIGLSKFLKIKEPIKELSKLEQAFLFFWCATAAILLAVMILFSNVTHFSYECGVEMGGKEIKLFNEFKSNGKRSHDDGIFMYRLNGTNSYHAGYIIAKGDDLIAFYTSKGEVFENIANISIQKIK